MGAQRKEEMEADWYELASAGKVWEKEVSYEGARRLHERRPETKREAKTLKARNKLYKHKEGG